ncbi:MAG: hypothetical protein KIT84_18095 [Labilithrix sp.]|nr:hypothetical protein [Labilithrix sp.]MCW5812945.1 hypothetical protein [Labilithrix sp.]
MSRSSVLFVSVAAIACSAGGVTGKADAQAILDARLDQGPDNTCALPGSLRNVGSFGVDGDAPAPVTDGTGGTGVVCTVRDNGDATFTIHGETYVNGERWFLVDGRFPAAYDKQANPDGVALPDLRVALFGAGPPGAATYAQNGGCRLAYLSDLEGAAGGRAWATVTCPLALRGELDAGDPAQTCTLSARFRFENCGS